VQTSSLSARVLGETGSAVVLLHGLVGSGIYWGKAYDRIADDHRLVVPDLVGFGRSPRPASGYGPDDHVDALCACLDDLSVDGPIVIGAHSLGTLIAIRFAAAYPERVAAIVAVGPPLYPDSATARAHVVGTGLMGRLFVLPGKNAERACRWVCGHRTLAAGLAVLAHPSLPKEVASDGVQHTWTSYSQTLQKVILAAEASDWLAQIETPLLIVAGVDDPIVDLAYLRKLTATHDNIELRELRGGHDLPLTHPVECTQMIVAAIALPSRPTAEAGI